jgi:hypothetical protein
MYYSSKALLSFFLISNPIINELCADEYHASNTTKTDLFKNLNTYDLNSVSSLLQPETILEQKIISSPEWLEGISWGKPRPGHPEGAVLFHILEVLNNVDDFYGNSPLREKLRIISIIHDTFKNKVDYSLPKKGENHHAMIARRFAEEFTDDIAILDVIQMHDDAYKAWNKGKRDGGWNKALEMAHQLIKDLGPNLELYISFYKCDNFTGNKTAEPYEWFQEIASHLLF